MPAPTLSPAEIARLTVEKARAESAAAIYQAAVAGQAARAAELAVADGAFKKFFDYYDANIIQKYDSERRWLNGYTLTSPVLEADIINCGSLGGGRLQPALPATDVIRIAQFDGTPFTTNVNNELQHIPDQATLETTLTTGYPGTAPGATVLTSTALTPASTTLSFKDLTNPFTVSINDVYYISDGVNFALVKILSVTLDPTPPPYITSCNIQMILAPVGTIALGQDVLTFPGFTNGERTAKIASDPDLQPLMNYLIAQLQSKINSRITALNNQLSPIAANQDPDGVAQLTTAASNVNTSKTFLTNYLVTTDISNTGLTSLSTERGTRTTQANARVTQIVNAYTLQTKNYYNERYNYANNRASTSRGSIRLQKAAEQTSAASQSFATTLTAQASAIDDILP